MNQRLLRIVAAIGLMVAMVVVGLPQGVALANTTTPNTPVTPVEISELAAPVSMVSTVAPELMQTTPMSPTDPGFPTNPTDPMFPFPTNPGFPTDPIAGTCTMDEDCAFGEMCETATGQCVPSRGGLECFTDAECEAGYACDTTSGMCVDAAGLVAQKVGAAGGSVPGSFGTFATDCLVGLNAWFGAYGGYWDPDVESLFATPRPAVVGNVSNDVPLINVDEFFGVQGWGYAALTYDAAVDLTYLASNPVFYTCDNQLNYNWRTGTTPTEYFGAGNIIDAANPDPLTESDQVFLGVDNWYATWWKRQVVNPDPSGTRGCKTIKRPGPGGGGVVRECQPGLYFMYMRVNDGGAVFINGQGGNSNFVQILDGNILGPDSWYAALQDRKSAVDVVFLFNAVGYARATGEPIIVSVDVGFDGLLNTDDDTYISVPYDILINMDYYEKDGRAEALLEIAPLVDGNEPPETMSVSADATVANDYVDGVVDNLVIPWDILPPVSEAELLEYVRQREPQQPTAPETPTAPEAPLLTPDQIVSTVYLPTLSN